MVRDWGLSPRLGPIGYGADGAAYLGAPALQGQARPYAEGTQQVIDEEVSRLLQEAEARAVSVLTEHRAALDAVVGLLLDRETISGDDLVQVVRQTDGGVPAPPGEPATPRALVHRSAGSSTPTAPADSAQRR
jgi:cell division protease FtsH